MLDQNETMEINKEIDLGLSYKQRQPVTLSGRLFLGQSRADLFVNDCW